MKTITEFSGFVLTDALKKLFEIRNDLFTTDIGSPLLFGSITAFITGLVAINFLIKYLRNHDLNVFIW
jgi:undecaprenyl pyrophosphate phosphatase UppP